MSRPLSTESAFRAIAHPTRRRLLELLSKRESAACDLARQFRHTQPVLSRHLRVLHGSGLVTCERRGANMIYRTVPGGLQVIRQWLESMDRPSARGSR